MVNQNQKINSIVVKLTGSKGKFFYFRNFSVNLWSIIISEISGWFFFKCFLKVKETFPEWWIARMLMLLLYQKMFLQLFLPNILSFFSVPFYYMRALCEIRCFYERILSLLHELHNFEVTVYFYACRTNFRTNYAIFAVTCSSAPYALLTFNIFF